METEQKEKVFILTCTEDGCTEECGTMTFPADHPIDIASATNESVGTF